MRHPTRSLPPAVLAAGFAQWELSESRPDSDRRRFARLAATSDDYPHLRAAAPHLSRRATAEQFRFTVDRLLDGLAPREAAAAG